MLTFEFSPFHSFLESIKMPSTTTTNGKINSSVTSSKPTSTFNICDILDLNKKKGSKKDSDDFIKKDLVDEQEEEEEEDIVDEEKPENLSDGSEEIINSLSEDENESKIKMQSELSPSRTESPQDSPKEVNKKARKDSKSDNNPSQHHPATSLLSDTLHQYPHLFQNHPAMRPWFSSNGKFLPFSNCC
jgi:hypothetical protein